MAIFIRSTNLKHLVFHLLIHGTLKTSGQVIFSMCNSRFIVTSSYMCIMYCNHIYPHSTLLSCFLLWVPFLFTISPILILCMSLTNQCPVKLDKINKHKKSWTCAYNSSSQSIMVEKSFEKELERSGHMVFTTGNQRDRCWYSIGSYFLFS